MKTNIIPIGENILIKLSEGDKTTKTGLIVKGDDKDESPAIRGVIVAISKELEDDYEDGGKLFPMEIGDVVLFRKFSGSHVPIVEEDMRLVEIHDILGKEE